MTSIMKHSAKTVVTDDSENKLPFKIRNDVPEHLKDAVIKKALRMYNHSIERGNKPWTIADFEIGMSLGKGKFGKVYLARDKVCHSHVAIKLLFKKKVIESHMEDKVVCDIKIQCRLKHPNIIQLLTYFSDEKIVYLVLEYAPGGNLFRCLQETAMNRFPDFVAAKYIYQVSDAVHFCHQNKVIHRNINPKNIFVSLDGNIKLSGFSLSVHAPTLKRRTECGAIDYLPPEMIHHKHYNEYVDNWCIGILCYVLLIGKPPFQSQNNEETFEKISNIMIDYPSHMCHGARNLISRLLRKKCKDRLSLPEVMEHEWIVSKLTCNEKEKIETK